MSTNRSLVFINRQVSRTKFHEECFSSLLDTKIDYLLTEGAQTCHLARYQILNRCINWGYDYIGWVDDDDVIVPGIHSKLEDILDRHENVAIAAARDVPFIDDKPNIDVGEGTIRLFKNIDVVHAPLLFRVSVLKNHYTTLLHKTHKSPERQLMMSMLDGSWYLAQIDELGYYWRQWSGQDHRTNK